MERKPGKISGSLGVGSGARRQIEKVGQVERQTFQGDCAGDGRHRDHEPSRLRRWHIFHLQFCIGYTEQQYGMELGRHESEHYGPLWLYPRCDD